MGFLKVGFVENDDLIFPFSPFRSLKAWSTITLWTGGHLAFYYMKCYLANLPSMVVTKMNYFGQFVMKRPFFQNFWQKNQNMLFNWYVIYYSIVVSIFSWISVCVHWYKIALHKSRSGLRTTWNQQLSVTRSVIHSNS